MTRRRWRASSPPATSACRRTAATTASPTARCRSRSSRTADLPVNTVAPSVTGTGYQGQPLTCNHGTWNAAAGSDALGHVVPREQDPVDPRALPRAEPARLQQHHHARRGRDGHQSALTWLDAQIVGTGDTYTPTAADIGKSDHLPGERRQRRRDRVQDRARAGDHHGDQRRRCPVGGSVRGDALADARRSGHVRRVRPGRRERLRRRPPPPPSSPRPATRPCPSRRGSNPVT